MKQFLNGFLFSMLVFLSTVGLADKKAHVHNELKAEGKIGSESVYNLMGSWTNQSGQSFKLSSLKGHPVVVVMVYTSCQSACPIIVSKVKEIDEKLSSKARADVRYLLVSFDPERDTIEKLKDYSETRKLDLDRWTLLNGKESSVREMAKVLGVKYKKSTNGDFDHSNIISVLDRGGNIKFQQIGLSSENDETIKEIEKIEKAP